MKEKDSIVDCPEQQVVLYVEKEDGNYEPVQTGSYITKNFLDDYKLKRQHLEDSLHQKVQTGEVSPIYYYMILEDLTISELSARTGFRTSKVKKHLETEYFKSLSQNALQIYCDVFNITIQDMLKLIIPATSEPLDTNTI
jgi:hypothetical protein